MLRALRPPKGAPPRPSPFLQRTYKWRLVDLEHFVKCNLSALALRAVYGPQCVHVFVNVSEGWGYGYSDDNVELSPDDKAYSDSDDDDSESSTDDDDSTLETDTDDSDVASTADSK